MPKLTGDNSVSSSPTGVRSPPTVSAITASPPSATVEPSH